MHEDDWYTPMSEHPEVIRLQRERDVKRFSCHLLCLFCSDRRIVGIRALRLAIRVRKKKKKTTYQFTTYTQTDFIIYKTFYNIQNIKSYRKDAACHFAEKPESFSVFSEEFSPRLLA